MDIICGNRSGRIWGRLQWLELFPGSEEQTTIENSYIPRVSTVVTRHGKLRSYLHKFGLINNPTWPCGEETEQTSDRLKFKCKKLRKQRNEVIKQIKKNTGGNWPTTNEAFDNNYLQIFVKFVESIYFIELWWHLTIKDREISENVCQYY